MTPRCSSIPCSGDGTPAPNAKRPRGQTEASENQWASVVRALSTCVSQQDRTAALSAGYKVFNHSNESIHDEEIECGADSALCRLLSFLLFKESLESSNRLLSPPDIRGAVSSQRQQASGHSIQEEISGTCQLIEMVYRCSKNTVQTSFEKVGLEFLSVLSHILTNELGKRTASALPSVEQPIDGTPSTPNQNLNETLGKQIHPEDVTRDNCMRSVTKILGQFARVPSVTVAMANYPGLIISLTTLVKCPAGVVPYESQHNALWVLANMACNSDNMLLMSSYGDLVVALIETANYAPSLIENKIKMKNMMWSDYYHALRSQCTAFRAILNLSWAQENRILLSENDDLLCVLGKTMVMRKSPWVGNARAINTILVQTRRFAVGTLRNIANTPPRRKHHLCLFQEGTLLNSLCDVAQHDEDPIVKDKAFAVIFNLTCIDTAQLLLSHPTLLGLLSQAASKPPDSKIANLAESSHTMAFRSLAVLDQAVASFGTDSSLSRIRQELQRVKKSRQAFGEADAP